MARLSDRVVTGAPNGVLSNDEPIQWYAADGITLIDGIKVDPTGAVYLAPAGGPTEVGGDLDVTGTINGTITGNASSATKLETARTIGITGDITSTAVAFDGTADIAISATVNTATFATTAGTVTTAAQPAITSVGTLTNLDVSGTATVDGLIVDGDIDVT